MTTIGLAGREPLDHLDLAFQSAAGEDALLVGLAVLDGEHLLHAREGDDGGRRDEDDGLVLLDDDLGRGKGARPEPTLRVGDLRLDRECPALLGDGG